MKLKIGLIILAVVSVGLLIALVMTSKQADELHSKDTASLLEFSNQLDAASINLNDLRQVNLMLTNDIATARQALETASNSLAETTGQLASAKTEIENDLNQITNLNGRISDLEAQNKVLDERANSLSNNIVSLNGQIAETQKQLADSQKQLADSQTNSAFLAAALRKQMAQKAELERRFSDLDEVRMQVKKLRDELFEARRLQWMSMGTSPDQQVKGATQLMQRTVPAPPLPPGIKRPSKPALPRYDLNVEVGSDGSVHVIQPTGQQSAPAPGPQDNPAQASARAALLNIMGGTNSSPPESAPR